MYSTRAPRAAQTAAVVADMLGLSVHTQLLGPTGSSLGEPTQELSSVVEPLGASRAVGEGEQASDHWAPRVGRELEPIAGAHPGETVVVVCHQVSMLAATQYFFEATYSRVHVSMEVDHTAVTEWQLRRSIPR